MSIKKLHHLAMRCRDSEETRHFYEVFLGLPLVHAIKIAQTKTGNVTNTLHIFFQLHDGSHLAFFESPGEEFIFKQQHDFDLHTALEVEATFMHEMVLKAKSLNIETRGISDHDFIQSVYFRDPNGYVVVTRSTRTQFCAAFTSKQTLAEWTIEKCQAGFSRVARYAMNGSTYTLCA